MASLTKAINKQFLDSVLPTYGNPRKDTPIYDNSQRAFICDQYESTKGHRYYKSLRFCDRLAIVEKVVLAYNWTYINGIEIYAFNGDQFELIQKKDFECSTYHSTELVKEEATKMLEAYFDSALKTSGSTMPKEQIKEEAKSVIASSYKSLLDEDYNLRLTQILPTIENH